MFKKTRSFHCLIFLVAILLVGCSVNQSSSSPEAIDLSAEDRVWIEKFFSDFFLKEAPIYTLFGSKPMSLISLCTASREDWVEGYARFLEDYSEEEKKELYIQLEEYLDSYDLPANWEKWIAWSSKHLDRSFIFAKKETEVKDLFSIYILDVQEAAWVLEKNYSWISRELGIEFDPLRVVLEFGDKNSFFWEKVFESHMVRGVLHGYGKRNAYFFDRSMELQEKNDFDLHTHPLFRSALNLKEKDSFPFPRFRSFSFDVAQDPVVQKYEVEKTEIQKRLEGKNSTELILHRLGYRSTVEERKIAFL